MKTLLDLSTFYDYLMLWNVAMIVWCGGVWGKERRAYSLVFCPFAIFFSFKFRSIIFFLNHFCIQIGLCDIEMIISFQIVITSPDNSFIVYVLWKSVSTYILEFLLEIVSYHNQVIVQCRMNSIKLITPGVVKHCHTIVDVIVI